MKTTRLLITTAALAIPVLVTAQDVPVPSTTKDIKYSPYLKDDYPNQVFFGDTHLHTSYSADAGMVGCTLGPDDAFRFAKGEEVTSSQGVPHGCNARLTSWW